MGPADSPPPACPSYLFPAQAGAHFPCSGTAGSPKFLVVLSVRAVSSTPESPPERVSIVLLRRFWFRPLRGIDHSHCWPLEADSSSLALRLAPLSSEASFHCLRGVPLGRLHVFNALLHG